MDCERLYGVVQAVSQTAAPAYDRLEVILTAVAVLVAALGVMFTVAAFVLGIFAFYGKKEFMDLAVKTAQGAATDWIEKNYSPEAMYAEFDRRNKPAANAPAPSPEVEASDEESVPQPTTDIPVEPGPQTPVTQPYPREEEPSAIQTEPKQAEGQDNQPVSAGGAESDEPEQTPHA